MARNSRQPSSKTVTKGQVFARNRFVASSSKSPRLSDPPSPSDGQDGEDDNDSDHDDEDNDHDGAEAASDKKNMLGEMIRHSHNQLRKRMNKQNKETRESVVLGLAGLKKELRSKVPRLVREAVREELDKEYTAANDLPRPSSPNASAPSPSSFGDMKAHFDDFMDTVDSAHDEASKKLDSAVGTMEGLSTNLNKRMDDLANSNRLLVQQVQSLSEIVLAQAKMASERDSMLQKRLASTTEHLDGVMAKISSMVDQRSSGVRPKLGAHSRPSPGIGAHDNVSNSPVPPNHPRPASHRTKTSRAELPIFNNPTYLSVTNVPASAQAQSTDDISQSTDDLLTQTDDTLVTQTSTVFAQALELPQSSLTSQPRNKTQAPSRTSQLLQSSASINPPVVSIGNRKTATPSTSTPSESPAPDSGLRRSARPTKPPKRLGSSGTLTNSRAQNRHASPLSTTFSTRGTKRGATEANSGRNSKRSRVSTSPMQSSEDEGFKDDMQHVKWPTMIPEPKDGEEMIQCDGCERWFHAGCVGLKQYQVQRLEHEKEAWGCPICAADGISKRRSGRTGRDGGDTCPRPDCTKGKDTYVITSVIGKRCSRSDSDDPDGDFEYLVTWEGWDLNWSEWRSENLPIFETQTSQDMISEFRRTAQKEGLNLYDGGDIKLLEIAEEAGFDPETGELRIQERKKRDRAG